MSLPVTDHFTGTSGTDLHVYNAGWTEQRASDTVCEISGVGGGSGNTAWGKPGGSEAAVKWDGDTFTGDQYAQCKAVNASNYGGPTVRQTGTTVATQNGYLALIDGFAIDLQRFDNGVRTNLQGGIGSIGAGDALKLEIVGTTLKVYVNGVQVGTNQTDSTYATGQPGMYFNGAASSELDDWTADTIPSGGGAGFIAKPFKTPRQAINRSGTY